MRTYGLLFFAFTLPLLAVLMLACGTSSQPTSRILQTVDITPSGASGEAQFEAFGFYNPPYPVGVSLTPTWGACYQNASTTEVSVSSSGFAKCAAGASGTYTIWGYAPSGAGVCPAENDVITACGVGACQVTGTAQLTCP
jgi:hypothetical protein